MVSPGALCSPVQRTDTARWFRCRCLILLVGEVLTTRILTHTQWARSVVQSYPFVLDVWALLRAVTGLYRAASAP